MRTNKSQNIIHSNLQKTYAYSKLMYAVAGA